MNSFLCLLLLVASIGVISCRYINDAGEFDALKYLEKAGYLDDLDNNNRYHAPDNVNQALKEFQQYAGLTVTGRLDKSSVEKMKQPRCGVPDVIKPSLRQVNDDNAPLSYVLKGNGAMKFKKNLITYKLNNYLPNYGHQAQRDVIDGALKSWSDVTPLNFVERLFEVDIDISFGKGNHGDKWVFDGPEGTLAHAFAPQPDPLGGDLHFDADEDWVLEPRVTGRKGIVLGNTALHELGHSLGLSHSTNPKAIMFPFYKGDASRLHQDDINGIQALYGRRK